MMLYPYCRKFSVIRQGYYYYRQHGESALASVLKNRKAYSETIARNLETIFRFYKERGLDEYFPIALRLLPYFHEWHNPRHYWQTMQQLNMHLDLENGEIPCRFIFVCPCCRRAISLSVCECFGCTVPAN